MSYLKNSIILYCLISEDFLSHLKEFGGGGELLLDHFLQPLDQLQLLLSFEGLSFVLGSLFVSPSVLNRERVFSVVQEDLQYFTLLPSGPPNPPRPLRW